MIPLKCKIIVVLFNCLFFQYCYRNIGLLFIAPCKVIALYLLGFFCIFFWFFLHISFYSYRSPNYRKGDIHKSLLYFLLLPVGAEKSDNFCYRKSWKSNNFMGIDRGKKPKPIKKWSNEIKIEKVFKKSNNWMGSNRQSTKNQFAFRGPHNILADCKYLFLKQYT